jgi:hypothetical protein
MDAIQVTDTLNEVWNNVNELRNFIREQVKENGAYEISSDYEDVSPAIYYSSNPTSLVSKLEWDEDKKDVIITCEGGEQCLKECNVNDILILAETIITLNSYKCSDEWDDEFEDDWQELEKWDEE